MIDLSFPRKAINVEALDGELKTAFGVLALGISTTPSELHVYLSDAATPEQLAQAEDIVKNHAPENLTPGQQFQAEHAKRLWQARQDNLAPLDVSVYAGQDPLIQRLAQKIAWLEMEIRQLW